jgi:hypothetical protein
MKILNQSKVSRLSSCFEKGKKKGRTEERKHKISISFYLRPQSFAMVNFFAKIPRILHGRYEIITTTKKMAVKCKKKN